MPEEFGAGADAAISNGKNLPRALLEAGREHRVLARDLGVGVRVAIGDQGPGLVGTVRSSSTGTGMRFPFQRWLVHGRPFERHSPRSDPVGF
jgi:hypothetical protein